MWQQLDHRLRQFYTLCGYVAAGCLMSIGLLVGTGILARLGDTWIAGLTEYSGYMMAAASFLALAYTFEHREHIRVDLVLGRLGAGPRLKFEVFGLCVAAVVSHYLAFYLLRLAWISWKFEQRSEGADALLLWIPQSVVASGSVVLALAITHHLLYALITGRRSPAPEAGAA